MELRRTHTLIFAMMTVWPLLLLALGAWWLYLIIELSNPLNGTLSKMDVIQLAKWEGGFFLLILIAVSSGLWFLYYRDVKKSQALHGFFASISHELKTPLASIRLQTEALEEFLPPKLPRAKKFVQRLVGDTQRLENELDKLLQLSRLERGGTLSLSEIPLGKYLRRLQNEMKELGEVSGNLEALVWGNEFAIHLIMKNLLDNTQKHSPSQLIEIKLRDEGTYWELIYSDGGKEFRGNINKLGKLFYKFNSPQGSGIGLYLVKKMMHEMGGNCVFTSDKGLRTHLFFKKARN